MHDILLDNSFITTQTIQVVFLNSNQEPFYSDFGYHFFFSNLFYWITLDKAYYFVGLKLLCFNMGNVEEVRERVRPILT